MRKRCVSVDSDQQKLLLTMEEAAQALSLGLSSVYSLVLHQKLRSIKVGRARRIPIASLHQFIDSQLHEQR